MVSTSEEEGDVVFGGGVGVCCELGLVSGDVATGFCELTCCGCWLDSGASRVIAESCPRQKCHAGKTENVISDSESDLKMTLIIASSDRVSRSGTSLESVRLIPASAAPMTEGCAISADSVHRKQ